MVVELDQPGIGSVKQVGSPLKLSRTPPDTERRGAGARRGHGRGAGREAGTEPQPLRDEGVV